MAPKTGNMTAGADGKNIDGMKLETFDKLIASLKDFSYQPNPARRVYIPKKNNPDKKRPLGIPSMEDKMVQYVVKYILEAIYEESFSNHSHGFRPMRSCHTALREIKSTYRGMKWFVEGDIKGFFDNIDHHVLVNILRRRIKDEHFLGLIWKFLKAGYLEDWQYHKTLSGTPQGGIISPILANIYLDELDSFMDKIQTEFNAGDVRRRKKDVEYERLAHQLWLHNKKMQENWQNWTEIERKEALDKRNEIRRLKMQRPVYAPMDDPYKRLVYVRYADDFLIGLHGSKAEAVSIKSQIKEFLSNQLHLELSDEKTLITHSGSMARFLGYDIVVRRDKSISRDKNGLPKRAYNYNVGLYVPHEVWKCKLLSLKAMKISKDANGKEAWKPLHKPELTIADDLEILSMYNAIIRGYHNYYQFADNSTVLQKFRYIMEYSMYKTFASKYKTTIGSIKRKYCVNGRFSIKYETSKGEKRAYFYDDSLAKENILAAPNLILPDYLPNMRWVFGVNSLINRLQYRQCELCGKADVSLEMHHVKRLKDLQGKQNWERVMLSKRRKTLALCHECHADITKQQKRDSSKARTS